MTDLLQIFETQAAYMQSLVQKHCAVLNKERVNSNSEQFGFQWSDQTISLVSDSVEHSQQLLITLKLLDCELN